MLVKIILVFLLVMALIGMVGKLLFPDAAARLTRRKAAVPCPRCGMPQIGKSGCSCKDRT